MGGSAKPRRRRAAAPALRYERQPRRTGSSSNPKKKGEFVFGCLIFLGIAGGIVLLATLDWFWGDDAWQWAAGAWPGGAYGFAGFLGVVGPCLVALCVFCLCRMQWKSWRQHLVRTLANTGAGAASAAALVPYLVLAHNAQDTGKWGKGRDGPPSWVFSHYPWLWAVGLLSTLAAMSVFAWAAVLYYRHRRQPGRAGDVGADGLPVPG